MRVKTKLLRSLPEEMKRFLIDAFRGVVLPYRFLLRGKSLRKDYPPNIHFSCVIARILLIKHNPN